MDFYQKYELLDLLKDEGVKVFNAREIAAGRRVTVFLFVGEQARLHADLLEQLRRSQRPDRPDLLEVGDNQGTPFVATEPLGGLADLKRIVAVSQAPPAAPRAGSPAEAFTRVGVWHIPGAAQSGARGGSHPAAPTGEVTPTAAPLTPAQPAATAPAAQPTPSEFTQMFQAAPPQPIGEAVAPPPPTSVPQAPAAAPPAQPAPGEFTRLFQAAPPQPIGEAVTPPPPPPVRQAPAAAPPAQPAPGGQVGDLPHGGGDPAPGEFTRLFQAAPPPMIGESVAPPPPTSVRQAPAAVPSAQPAPGEFTRLFESRLSQSPAPEPVLPPRGAPHQPAPPPSSAPGEFTRIFGREDMPAPQAPPPGQTPGSIAAGTGATQSFRARPEFASPAAPAPSAGPGEYTRMFGVRTVPQPQAPVPAQSSAPTPAPAAAKKVQWLPVVLIGAIVVLLGAIAIIIFALKK